MVDDAPLDTISQPQEDQPTESVFKLTGKQSGERNWYVIHTYSGYEDQVAANLKQRIESFSMPDKIFDVIVPKEKQIEIKGGKKRLSKKESFQGMF
jgi:hypothetical protein